MMNSKIAHTCWAAPLLLALILAACNGIQSPSAPDETAFGAAKRAVPVAVSDSPYVIIVYAAAVGIAMFVMVVFDLEHPPAAGTALGIAILGAGEGAILAVLIGSVVLALAHRLLRRWLRDLT